MFASNITHTNRRGIYILTALTLLLMPMLSRASGNVRAAPASTEIGGPIISDTTWTLANNPYIVVANVEVWQGVTLTIEPGVIVKFNKDKLLQVDGVLIAQGTAANPITFTSNQASPKKGDWGNIGFTNTAIPTAMDAEGNYVSGSTLQYCVVEYGGAAGSAIGAYSLLIDHCTVRNNLSWGIATVGAGGASMAIRNNTVSGNSGGISASYYSSVTGNIVSGNYYNGISVSFFSSATGNTVSGNSTLLGGISASHDSAVISNTVTGNSAIRGGGIYADAHSMVISNTVTGNSAIRGGGIYASRGSTVTGNIVSGNWTQGAGGGIYAEEYSPVTGNIVSGNSARYSGGGIHANGHSMVMGNTIVANSVSSATGKGSGVYFSGSNDFLYNTVVGNITSSPTAVTGGVALDDYGALQFHHNNLYGNSNYDVVVLSSGDISGTHNYWGTVATVDILAHIYDWYDDSSRGRLLFIPYIQDPDPNVPMPPPQNLRAIFTGDSVSLSWDAIPNTATGYGYKIYYDTDASGPPYHGAGAAQGNSPIDMGNATQFTLSGLGSGRIFIVVTAYDTQGHEGWYSNEVNRWQTYLPAVLKR